MNFLMKDGKRSPQLGEHEKVTQLKFAFTSVIRAFLSLASILNTAYILCRQRAGGRACHTAWAPVFIYAASAYIVAAAAVLLMHEGVRTIELVRWAEQSRMWEGD
jgi:hypothetical protein